MSKIAGALAVVGFAGLFLWPAYAQEGTAASRREEWRFREADVAVPSKASVVARASREGDIIVVLADGIVVYDVGKTWSTCTSSKDFRQQWVATLPPAALDRIRLAGTAAGAEGRDLDMIELLDLARVPRRVRTKVFGGMRVDFPLWPERHQNWDGRWSPAKFDDHCEGPKHHLCTGIGKESFALAATGLLSICYSNLGYPHRYEDDRSSAAERALRFLLTSQKPDGSFAAADDPAPDMTDACVSIALSRGLIITQRGDWDSRPEATGSRPAWVPRLAAGAKTARTRVAANQNSDGSWGKQVGSHALSVTAWNLLAMRAGQQAAIGTDPIACKRAVNWIERAVASAEARNGITPVELARARSIRAIARTVEGTVAEPDVKALVDLFNLHGSRVLDAESLLFGTLAAYSVSGEAWDSWDPIIGTCVRKTQETEGCRAHSWMVPCIWSDAGGRLVSTALMTWLIEIYYRYPMTFIPRVE